MNPKRIAKAVAISCAVAALAWFSFFGGYRLGAQDREIIVAGVINQETGMPEEVDFGAFWDVWKLVRQNYFKSESVSNKTLVYGAIQGMVQALGDPHSSFFPPEESKRFEEDIAGEFGGVGMEIGIRDKIVTVIAPLKGTPAERGGVHAGDSILKINDEFTTDMTVDEAVKRIRGVEGTEVTLLLMREGWESPQEFKLTRSIITIEPLEYKLLDGGIAHIALYNFNENVPKAFYKMAVGLVQDNPKGIILDLRNNPGGYLEVSRILAGWFLNRGALVTKEVFRTGDANEYRTDGNTALRSYPLVVLVNEGSASASEILAGALRDNRNIKLIGTKTFGKGSVQEVRSLKDGSSLKVSIAQWLTPNGSLIDGIGLEPDIVVEAAKPAEPEGEDEKKDPQLDKAQEILKALIAGN
jgi:carboxyl-terminal processing protease